MPTALVLIDNGVKTFETRVILDACCSVSRINASLATSLGLSVTRMGADSACTAIIRAKTDATVRLEVVLNMEPHMHATTQDKDLPCDIVKRFTNIALANNLFYRRTTTPLVLGANVFQRVIRPGLLPSVNGDPEAQNTVFGWILSGSCRV